MNENRIDLTLPSSISDKIVAESEESEILFADGFGIVTDLQVGPDDGYLYLVAGDRPTKTGALYRIVPQ